MITKDDGAEYFHLWTDHTDGSSNFAICDRLRPGEEPTDPSDVDAVLDRLYLLDDEVKLAFSDYGFIGPEIAKEVDEHDARCLKMINALVHAYIEFDKGKQFVLEIHSNKPYTPCRFYERVGVLRYDFLSPETSAKIDEFMPSVVKLEYTRKDGMSYYDLGPADPQEIVITAEDMPSEEEIRETLKPFFDVPAPHILEDFILLEQAA